MTVRVRVGVRVRVRVRMRVSDSDSDSDSESVNERVSETFESMIVSVRKRLSEGVYESVSVR